VKERSNQLALFTVFLLPLLVIIASPSFSTLAMKLDGRASRNAAGPTMQSFYAMGGVNDGWILESGPTTSVGGSMTSASTAIPLGDDKFNDQMRGIVSFDTSALPDSSTVVSTVLYLRGAGVYGINPFVFGTLVADVRRGAFGGSAVLQLLDFQAPANMNAAGSRASCPATGTCTIPMLAGSLPFVNRVGLTQYRLRFVPADNHNFRADYYKIWSGDMATKGYKPGLLVGYYP